MYAHNELVQFLLDIGWVPALTLFAAVIKPVFSKKYNPYLRIAVIVFILHSLFDFNLQYISVLVLLFMFTDITGGKNAFSKELLAEDDNVVLRLKFRLRGSMRSGDVCDLIFEDAVFAASDETQSLAMTTGTLKVKNGKIVAGE